MKEIKVIQIIKKFAYLNIIALISIDFLSSKKGPIAVIKNKKPKKRCHGMKSSSISLKAIDTKQTNRNSSINKLIFRDTEFRIREINVIITNQA